MQQHCPEPMAGTGKLRSGKLNMQGLHAANAITLSRQDLVIQAMFGMHASLTGPLVEELNPGLINFLSAASKHTFFLSQPAWPCQT